MNLRARGVAALSKIVFFLFVYLKSSSLCLFFFPSLPFVQFVKLFLSQNEEENGVSNHILPLILFLASKNYETF